MRNEQYDPAEILPIIADYMKRIMQPDELKLPIQKLYDKIKRHEKSKDNKHDMPEFSQVRKYIINELKNNDLYSPNDKLTSETAYRLTQIFNNEKPRYNGYDISLYSDDVIICTAALPSDERLDNWVKHYSGNRQRKTSSKPKKEKILYVDKIKMIWRLCRRIKLIAPQTILAVIPEFDPMIYLSSEARIDLQMKPLDPICNSICIFLKNNEKGKKLAERMKSPHFIYKAILKKFKNIK